MKIAVTGGHFTPALAVMEELLNNNEIVFIGRKYGVGKERNLSLEFKEIGKRKIPFYHLDAGRFTRLFTLQTFINILKIPFGILKAWQILKKEKPDIIMSFGGYIAFSVCLSGYFLNIPVYIHEQTIQPGITNRFIGLLAKKIFLAFPQSGKYFPQKKILVTGNPVRKNVLTVQKKSFILPVGKPVIYVTGGSLGSHSINILIEQIINKLSEKYVVIHQTGNVEAYHDYERLLKLKSDNYLVADHFMDDDLGYIYSVSDLMISRSGANSFFEIIAWKKPAILIPLPWSANQEQYKQADFLKKNGVGEIFLQNESPEKLQELISSMMLRLQTYKTNFKNLEKLYQSNAAATIAKFVTHKS